MAHELTTVPRATSTPHHDASTAFVLGALFGVLGVAVATGVTQPLDDTIRRCQPRPRRGAARSMAEGIKEVFRPEGQIVMSVVASLVLERRDVPRAYRVATAVACTVLIDKAIKKLVDRRRPPGYRGHQTCESFPSGHTAAAVAMAVTVSHLLRRSGDPAASRATVGAWATSALIAESRLLLDDHWPSDVVGGALLGGVVAHAVLMRS